jgi:hypothetical protein
MQIYGLYGRTHGGARLLTVMCSEGTAAALELMGTDEDLIIRSAPGRLTQYHEKRSGALERLIATWGVVVLNKVQWDTRKAALGEQIW